MCHTLRYVFHNCFKLHLQIAILIAEEFVFSQGPLGQLATRKVSQRFQGVLVPWIISKYGILYKKDCAAKDVRSMLLAIIQCDNIAGLGKDIKVLAARNQMEFDNILGINVAKGRTVKAILQDEFPPLDRDGGKADKLVLFRTMEYVQANIILGAMLQVQCYI